MIMSYVLTHPLLAFVQVMVPAAMLQSVLMVTANLLFSAKELLSTERESFGEMKLQFAFNHCRIANVN